MTQHVSFNLTKFTSITPDGKEVGEPEIGYIAYGFDTDIFDYLEPSKVENMTPELAYELLGDTLQIEADADNGFNYNGNFVQLRIDAE